MKLDLGRGNQGETDLLVGGKIQKSASRVEAFGTVDELNSSVGLARTYIDDEQMGQLLLKIQEHLFILGSDLAAKQGENTPRITDEHITWIETQIKKVLSELKSRDNFVFPGGSKASACLHLCRTICRRMERRIQELSRIESINRSAFVFSNRLSSLLYGLALLVNKKLGVEEVEWIFKGKKG